MARINILGEWARRQEEPFTALVQRAGVSATQFDQAVAERRQPVARLVNIRSLEVRTRAPVAWWRSRATQGDLVEVRGDVSACDRLVVRGERLQPGQRVSLAPIEAPPTVWRPSEPSAEDQVTAFADAAEWQ